MAKQGKQDLVFDNYYGPHLYGGRKNNPAMNLAGAVELMYCNTLTELCANRFEWKGLPDSINPRYLEMLLFTYGLAVFYVEDTIGKPVALQAAAIGQPNYQGEPIEYQVLAPGRDNINKTVGIADCVPIWANYLRAPELDKVLIYAQKLAKLDATIDINLDGMRYNKIVFADEDQRLSYKQLLQQQATGGPVIFGARNLDMANITAFDVGVPVEAVPNLMIAKSKIWNECMSMLGINNANQDKRERLVADEVAANDAQIGAMQNIALNSRQYAAKQISAMFNLTVTVDFKQKVEPEVEPANNNDDKD